MMNHCQSNCEQGQVYFMTNSQLFAEILLFEVEDFSYFVQNMHLHCPKLESFKNRNSVVIRPGELLET